MTALVGFAFIVPVLLLGVLVLTVSAVAAGRNEPDPDGERPYALYLAAVAFVSIFLALGAVGTIIASGVDAGLGDDGPSFTSVESITIGNGAIEDFEAPEPSFAGSGDERDNERIRSIVAASLVGAVAAALFVLHDRRLDAFRRRHSGPGWRTAQTEGYVVCFLALLTALAGVVVLGYALFEMIAPGIAGIEERKDGLQPALVSAGIALAAAGVFVLHWRQLDRGAPSGGSWLTEAVAPLPPPTDIPPPPPPPPTTRRERPLRRPTI